MERFGKPTQALHAKSQLESALSQMYHFAGTTLPSAMSESFWCEGTIKKAVDQALFCQDCASKIPQDLLDSQLAVLMKKKPGFSFGVELTTDLFKNGLEQLYINFAQNSLTPPDTLKKVNDVFEARVGLTTLLTFQEKTGDLFEQYEEISNFLNMCPSETVMQVEAQLIAEKLENLEDKEKLVTKIRSLLDAGYKYRCIVLYLLGWGDCTFKDSIVETIRKELDEFDLNFKPLPIPQMMEFNENNDKGNPAPRDNVIVTLFFNTDATKFCKAIVATASSEEDNLLKIFVQFVNQISGNASFVEQNSTQYEWEIDVYGVNFMSIRDLIKDFRKKETSRGMITNAITAHLTSLAVCNSLFWEDLLLP